MRADAVAGDDLDVEGDRFVAPPVTRPCLRGQPGGVEATSVRATHPSGFPPSAMYSAGLVAKSQSLPVHPSPRQPSSSVMKSEKCSGGGARLPLAISETSSSPVVSAEPVPLTRSGAHPEAGDIPDDGIKFGLA